MGHTVSEVRGGGEGHVFDGADGRADVAEHLLDVGFGRGDEPRGFADLGESRGDEVGVDETDDDAFIFELAAEGLGEGVHEGLAAAVDGEQRAGHGAAEGANVGNPSAFSESRVGRIVQLRHRQTSKTLLEKQTDWAVIFGTTILVMLTRPSTLSLRI